MRDAVKERHAMRAHLFRRGDTNLYCLTGDREGRNIPPQPGPEAWQYIRAVELHPKELRLAVDSDAAIADLAQRGYHFVHGWYHQQ